MKTQTVIFALATVIFAAPALADHNERDEQGRKHGHWTEFPEDEILLSAEGIYVHGKRRGNWVLRYTSGSVSEGPYRDGKQHGKWVLRKPDGTVINWTFRNGELIK